MHEKDLHYQLNTILTKAEFNDFLGKLFLSWGHVSYCNDRNSLGLLLQSETKVFPLVSNATFCGVIVFQESSSYEKLWGLIVSIFQELATVATRVNDYEANLLVIKKITALSNIQKIANSSLELSKVYDNIVSELKNFISFNRVSIALFNKEKTFLNTYALVDEHETQLVQGTILPLDETSPGWILKHGKPNIEHDFLEKREFIEDEIFVKEGYRSALRVPLVFKGDMIGTINLSSYIPYNFLSYDEEMIEQVASVLAYSLVNAQLIKDTQTNTMELEKENHKLQFLNNIARIFAGVTDTKFSFGEILKEIVNALDLEGAQYFFRVNNRLHHEKYYLHKKQKVTKLLSGIKELLTEQGLHFDEKNEVLYLLIQTTNNAPSYLVLTSVKNELVEDKDFLLLLTKQLSIGTENYFLYSYIRKLNDYDALTDLPNKKKFFTDLGREIARAKRGKKKLVALIADIDDFKAFNDSYGHASGDEVLKEVAFLIKNSLRKSDIAGRFGGEEFLIALPNTDLANGLEYTNRLMKKLFEHTVTGQVSASVGITELLDSDDAFTLISRADNALYDAKGQGKNQVVIA